MLLLGEGHVTADMPTGRYKQQTPSKQMNSFTQALQQSPVVFSYMCKIL